MRGEYPMSNKIAVASGLVAIATGVVGLAGASMGLLDRFKGKADADPAAALKNAPEVIDGYLSGPAFVEAWSQGLLCSNWNPADRSCASTMEIVQRSNTSVRSSEDLSYAIDDGSATAEAVRNGAEGELSGYGHVEQAEYAITRTGICASNAVLAQGAQTASPYGIAADGSGYPEVSEEGVEAYRQALAADYATAAVGGEQCWRYKRSADGKTFTSQVFMGDVPQPNTEYVYTLLPLGTEVEIAPVGGEAEEEGA